MSLLRVRLLYGAVDVIALHTAGIELHDVADSGEVFTVVVEIVEACTTEVEAPVAVDAELPTVGVDARILAYVAEVGSIPSHECVAAPAVEVADDTHGVNLGCRDATGGEVEVEVVDTFTSVDADVATTVFCCTYVLGEEAVVDFGAPIASHTLELELIAPTVGICAIEIAGVTTVVIADKTLLCVRPTIGSTNVVDERLEFRSDALELHVEGSCGVSHNGCALLTLYGSVCADDCLKFASYDFAVEEVGDSIVEIFGLDVAFCVGINVVYTTISVGEAYLVALYGSVGRKGDVDELNDFASSVEVDELGGSGRSADCALYGLHGSILLGKYPIGVVAVVARSKGESNEGYGK